MGCDIHVQVQVRRNGDWQTLEKPKGEYGHEWSGIEHRCYDAFAILANVRNGAGFAGIDTGDGFRPVSEPRDLPDDFEAPEDAYMGDHSFSWLNLGDLQSIDWTQTTKKRGVISLSQYMEWRKVGGFPNGWSGGISGPNIVTRSTEETELGLAIGELPRQSNRNGEIDYVRVEWPATYAECASGLKKFIEETLTPMGDPDDVRIVFGFDS